MSNLQRLIDLMRAHRNQLEEAETRDVLQEQRAVILPSVRTTEGEEGWEVSLLEALETPWDGEACLVPYHTTPPVLVTQTTQAPKDLSFRMLLYDFDTKPKRHMTWETWLHVLNRSWTYDATPMAEEAGEGPTPNILYATKHGIRCILLTHPFSDPLAYVAAWKRKATRLRHMLPATDWTFDATGAWNHLFRAPHVVYTDKQGQRVDTRGSPIWVWHHRRTLVTRAAPTKPRRKRVKATPATDAARKWLDTVPGATGHGGSLELDRRTFWIACELIGRYGLSAAAALALLADWNDAKCDSPWTEAQLRHKVEAAVRTVESRR